MTLSLYMDHHIDSAITTGLRKRGIDVLTTQQDRTSRTDDEVLLRRATDFGRILVSHDRDLLGIANRWAIEGRVFAGLVHVESMACTIGEAIEDLELIVHVYTAEQMQNRVEFIPY